MISRMLQRKKQSENTYQLAFTCSESITKILKQGVRST